MHCRRLLNSMRNLSAISWESTGKLQQTLASEISRSGTGLHSAASSTVKLCPAMAGEGRFFVCGGDRRTRIPASVDCVMESPLCTMLGKGDEGDKIKTVEHLLSALEAAGVDNCGIEITGGNEVPLLDGSAKEWLEAIEEAGLCNAKGHDGNTMDKLSPLLSKPVHVWKNDSFVAAFPSPKVQITYGIHFPQVPAIGQQWFSCFPMDKSVYSKEIACARTFGIYEEVEKLRQAGLIQGGSLENAIVCRFAIFSFSIDGTCIFMPIVFYEVTNPGNSPENSTEAKLTNRLNLPDPSANAGWLNPPLHFHDEPCRHKVLDLIGDLSVFAQNGSQGLPVAHIVAYKAGHSLHAEFVRCLLNPQ